MFNVFMNTKMASNFYRHLLWIYGVKNTRHSPMCFPHAGSYIVCPALPIPKITSPKNPNLFCYYSAGLNFFYQYLFHFYQKLNVALRHLRDSLPVRCTYRTKEGGRNNFYAKLRKGVIKTYEEPE